MLEITIEVVRSSNWKYLLLAEFIMPMFAVIKIFERIIGVENTRFCVLERSKNTA